MGLPAAGWRLIPLVVTSPLAATASAVLLASVMLVIEWKGMVVPRDWPHARA